jgi:hypothetical protein
MAPGRHRRPTRGGIALTPEQTSLIAVFALFVSLWGAAVETIGLFTDSDQGAIAVAEWQVRDQAIAQEMQRITESIEARPGGGTAATYEEALTLSILVEAKLNNDPGNLYRNPKFTSRVIGDFWET